MKKQDPNLVAFGGDGQTKERGGIDIKVSCRVLRAKQCRHEAQRGLSRPRPQNPE